MAEDDKPPMVEYASPPANLPSRAPVIGATILAYIGILVAEALLVMVIPSSFVGLVALIWVLPLAITPLVLKIKSRWKIYGLAAVYVVMVGSFSQLMLWAFERGVGGHFYYPDSLHVLIVPVFLMTPAVVMSVVALLRKSAVIFATAWIFFAVIVTGIIGLFAMTWRT